jgi:beta-glucosidase
VSYPGSPARRPVKELKGFYRVALEAAGAMGDAKRITIPLRVSDLKYYDMTTNTWQVASGQVKVMVGPSSANLPLSDTFTVK